MNPGLTVGAGRGPYYVTNAAQLPDGNVNATGLPGDPIKVSGHVYGGEDTSTPLPGARIEIWHADASGSYHPNAGGDASDFRADELALRGYVLASGSGYYEFTSIYPGKYPGRCRHIHVRASEIGFRGGVSITTQLIVPAKEGDDQTPETDSVARALPPANHLSFIDIDGVQEATFDFHLGHD